LDSLNGVKDIIESNDFSNDEIIHLIQSQFIVENAEMKQLDQEIQNLPSIEAFFKDHLGQPEGQMTIFEFIGTNPNRNQASPFHPEPSESSNGLSKELIDTIGTMQVLANTVLSSLEK